MNDYCYVESILGILHVFLGHAYIDICIYIGITRWKYLSNIIELLVVFQ